MAERKARIKHLVRGGRFIVEVDVDVVYPSGWDNPCFEPEVNHWLDTIAERARMGDVKFLRTVGNVYEPIREEAPAA